MATESSLPTVRDILTFHSLDRSLYDRVLAQGVNPCDARNIVALWMWLEILGMHIVLHLNRCCHNHAVVRRFIIEAGTILNVIRPEAQFPSSNKSGCLIPFTANLVREALDLKFFYFHCDVVVKGIAHVLDGVGRLVFDDDLKALLDSYRARVKLARIEGRELPAVSPALRRSYEAKTVASAAESSRSLFISFPKGYNLSADDIVNFFSQKWRDCIDKVVIERTPRAASPMHGRVAFKSEAYVALMLGGEKLIKFPIKGKIVWARRYISKNNQ